MAVMPATYRPSTTGLDNGVDRSPEIPAPTRPPITYRGREITPGHILTLWRTAMSLKSESRKRILTCREYRRMAEETLIQVSSKWMALYPEAKGWVQEVLEERITLDANMVARVGVVEPEFSVAPIATENLDPFTKTAHDLAEAREACLEEWRKSDFGVPTQVFFGKGTEDGEYARITLPTDLDMDGCPTFFETLDQRAYDAADEREQAQYREDEDAPKRAGQKRYVKVDERGNKVVRERYRPKPLSDDEEKLSADDRDKVRAKRERDSEEAHLADVRRYLLDKQASNTRVISALDCAPIFTRGKGRERWELTALVERSLFYVEELLEQKFSWQGMGDRQFVPLAYEADGTRMSVAPSDIGDNSQVYLYTAYLICTDEEGHRRPIVAYTVGGAATSFGTATDPDDPNEVGLIDLYEEYGLEGPLWSYHGGLHTEDDSPDHYWRPYIWPFIRRIRGIEGNKTAMNAANHAGSFPGQYYRPDAKIAALENADEFLLDQDGELNRPKLARAGELEPAVGEIFSAPPPGIGPDAWRTLQADLQSLAAATAIDQVPTGGQPSGASIIAQTTIGQVAKRHIREGALAAVIRSGEDHLKILDAIYRKHGVRWPFQTVDERPVGDEERKGVSLAEYDPRWIGEGMFRLRAEYPEEENLARIDLEMSLQQAGIGSTERVYKAMGEKDTARARLNADKDRLMKHPAIDALRLARVAKKTGDRDMQAILKLQAAQEMSTAEIPGMEGGIPTSALRRSGERGLAAKSRAGQISGAMVGSRAAADTEAAMSQTQMGAA